MRFQSRRAAILFACALQLALPAIGFAQADPDPARFAEAIERFRHWDTQNAYPEENVVFVGSSSIVYWPTANRFPDLPVVNRGFGGSHISDVNHYIEQTVVKYSPEIIVFYAGNNDINAGKSPAQVLEDYQQFVRQVHARKRETQIIFVSLHPSIARWAKWPAMQETNASIKAYSEQNPNLHFVDISRPMLGSNGEPIPSLFVEDGLHLTLAGYDVWTPIVARAIASVGMATSCR